MHHPRCRSLQNMRFPTRMDCGGVHWRIGALHSARPGALGGLSVVWYGKVFKKISTTINIPTGDLFWASSILHTSNRSSSSFTTLHTRHLDRLLITEVRQPRRQYRTLTPERDLSGPVDHFVIYLPSHTRHRQGQNSYGSGCLSSRTETFHGLLFHCLASKEIAAQGREVVKSRNIPTLG